MNAQACPHCAAKPKELLAPGHAGTAPSEGDFYVCGRCGSISCFDAELNLGPVSEAIWNAARAVDPDACRQMLLTATLARVTAAARRQKVAAIARSN